MKRHVASLVSAVAALGACSEANGPPPPPPPARPATQLEISAWPAGRSGEEREWTLRCSPTGGTHPDPAEACRRLATLDRPFFRPDGVACTEIYGGPAVAEVRGEHGGRTVEFTFSRSDGCEIALWDRHGFLFPVLPP
ncbi:MAG: subtilase-type protease inhibitor [Actinomycetota bacterium]|nr:subtilase-type protease inhibitor [Actinomycetota bacterium]